MVDLGNGFNEQEKSLTHSRSKEHLDDLKQKQKDISDRPYRAKRVHREVIRFGSAAESLLGNDNLLGISDDYPPIISVVIVSKIYKKYLNEYGETDNGAVFDWHRVPYLQDYFRYLYKEDEISFNSVELVAASAKSRHGLDHTAELDLGPLLSEMDVRSRVVTLLAPAVSGVTTTRSNTPGHDGLQAITSCGHTRPLFSGNHGEPLLNGILTESGIGGDPYPAHLGDIDHYTDDEVNHLVAASGGARSSEAIREFFNRYESKLEESLPGDEDLDTHLSAICHELCEEAAENHITIDSSTDDVTITDRDRLLSALSETFMERLGITEKDTKLDEDNTKQGIRLRVTSGLPAVADYCRNSIIAACKEEWPDAQVERQNLTAAFAYFGLVAALGLFLSIGGFDLTTTLATAGDHPLLTGIGTALSPLSSPWRTIVPGIDR